MCLYAHELRDPPFCYLKEQNSSLPTGGKKIAGNTLAGGNCMGVPEGFDVWYKEEGSS